MSMFGKLMALWSLTVTSRYDARTQEGDSVTEEVERYGARVSVVPDGVHWFSQAHAFTKDGDGNTLRESIAYRDGRARFASHNPDGPSREPSNQAPDEPRPDADRPRRADLHAVN